jgi:hypothetical protein
MDQVRDGSGMDQVRDGSGMDGSDGVAWIR